jgi:hypothetical protein
MAEDFAHMVYDMPVSDMLAKAVRRTVEEKISRRPSRLIVAKYVR